FETAITNCLRYLKLTDYDQILRMSVAEYNARMEAFRLQREDEREQLHIDIWLAHRVVKATDKKGEYVLKTFDDFYKNPTKQNEKKETFNRLHQIRRNLEKFRKEGGN